MKKDHFAHKADSYEKEVRRTENVTRIADLILGTFTFDQEMHVMDFGSGTGLLLERIAPYVGKITAVDMSPSMNQVLAKKSALLPCDLTIQEIDLSKETIPETFDAVISSMTLHHVADTLALFQKFYHMLHEGGWIALADLDSEDGTFHTKDTGVFHFGFDRDTVVSLATEAGFAGVQTESVGDVVKPYGTYPVFLLTATKPISGAST